MHKQAKLVACAGAVDCRQLLNISSGVQEAGHSGQNLDPFFSCSGQHDQRLKCAAKALDAQGQEDVDMQQSLHVMSVQLQKVQKNRSDSSATSALQQHEHKCPICLTAWQHAWLVPTALARSVWPPHLQKAPAWHRLQSRLHTSGPVRARIPPAGTSKANF